MLHGGKHKNKTQLNRIFTFRLAFQNKSVEF